MTTVKVQDLQPPQYKTPASGLPKDFHNILVNDTGPLPKFSGVRLKLKLLESDILKLSSSISYLHPLVTDHDSEQSN